MEVSTLLYAVAAVAILAVAGAVFGLAQFFALSKRLNLFFEDKGGKDLEGFLAEQGKKIRDIEQEFRRLRDDVARLDVMATSSIQKVGLVRFNPFEDTGGDQSFAAALLDSEDNGIVVSSLHSREGTRVYAKSIVRRDSKHHLSDEEREAIRRALHGE